MRDQLVAQLQVSDCVIAENIHTSPTEGIFSKTPHPLWKFQLSFIHFFKFFGLAEPPTPTGNSNHFCGASMDIFWNCTFELFVIGYPYDSHVNYACLNGFLHNVSFSFQNLGKVLQTFLLKRSSHKTFFNSEICYRMIN